MTHIYVGGEVRPCALNALDNSLSTQDPVRANFQRDSCDFTGKRRELFDHGIDSLD